VTRPDGDALPDVTLRLREQTRADHQRVEEGLHLLDGSLTFARYRQVLGRFRGYYAVLEPALDAWHAREQRLDWPARRKLHLIDADLQVLGWSPAEIDRLPRSPHVPAVDTTAHALGALYVVEGATRGGAVIAVRLRDGLIPVEALSFLSCYGRDVNRRWRQWAAATRAWVGDDRGRSDAVVVAARAEFQRLGEWLVRPEEGT